MGHVLRAGAGTRPLVILGAVYSARMLGTPARRSFRLARGRKDLAFSTTVPPAASSAAAQLA